MTYREFRNLVLTTLDTQQTFFKAKKLGLSGKDELEKSRSLERLVRKTIKEENTREKDIDQITLWENQLSMDDQEAMGKL